MLKKNAEKRLLITATGCPGQCLSHHPLIYLKDGWVWHWDLGLVVGLAVLGSRLDLMILKVFPSLKALMIFVGFCTSTEETCTSVGFQFSSFTDNFS